MRHVPLLVLLRRGGPAFCDLRNMMQETDPDWAQIRADYEARIIPLTDLWKRHDIGRTELENRIRQENWPRRTKPRSASRSALISRLYRLLERQIAQLEINMDIPGDKEVTVLGNLTRNLEKLVELDLKEKGRKRPANRRDDIDALRQKLADRIERLKKS